MEWDELKNSWDLLDRRLQQNELLNVRIIREMLRERTVSILNTYIRREIIGVVSTIWILIFLIIVRDSLAFLFHGKPAFELYFLLFSLLLLFQSISLCYRLRIDLNNQRMDHIIKLINRHWYFEKYATIIIIIATIVFLGFTFYWMRLPTPFNYLFHTFLLLLLAVGCVWAYYFGWKSTQRFKKNLKDWKEFEKEQ